MPLKLEDLSPEVRKRVGVRKPRGKTSFTKDKVASHAIAALFPLKDLTRSQRERVLEHALKMNKS